MHLSSSKQIHAHFLSQINGLKALRTENAWDSQYMILAL
jgi:hypothetical protein